MQQSVQTSGWHTEKWGTWGWLETVLKLVAIVAGIAAFLGSTSASGFVLANNPHLAAVIVLVLLNVVSVGVIAVRYGQREIISMIFAVLNLLGHLGLLVALLRVPDQAALPIAFGVFYVLGQLIKLQFLRISGYTEGGQPTSQMLRVTAILTAVYVVFVVFMLL